MGHPCPMCSQTYLTLAQLQSHLKELQNNRNWINQEETKEDEFTNYEINDDDGDAELDLDDTNDDQMDLIQRDFVNNACMSNRYWAETKAQNDNQLSA